MKIIKIINILLLALVVLSVCASAAQTTFYRPTWEGDKIRNNHGGVLTLAYRSDAHYPSLEEAISFVNADHTDEHPFEYGKFDCSDFAQNFQHNATGQGLHCEVCVMRFHRAADNNGWDGHYINAFRTTDAGLLLIDCTAGDCVAQVEKGEIYTAVPFDQPDTMRTWEAVEDFIITEYRPRPPIEFFPGIFSMQRC